ncbi:MAG: phosphate ABC transporter ATP-binding protein [Elusimicrobia bacterium]|nr:phosphate ABC transporter ATP-binding protein [Elusimicrobiota bacterium]
MPSPADKLVVERLRVRKGKNAILNGVSLTVRGGEILALIGPAGSGKTTFLRCLNRLIDLEPELAVEGRLRLDGLDVYGEGVDVPSLRRRIGMVFAVPNPLPMSIRDNLTLGLRILGAAAAGPPSERIERSLKAAYLWDEVKDRLDDSALKLSGGQQQRLCLARSLMAGPELLLLDEPCSGLDPISTAKIEEALQGLKSRISVVLVTNNVKQASRCSDRTAFLLMGDLVEMGETGLIFTNPQNRRTADYVSGRFG